MALVGEGVCFILNAISYLAVIIALSAMRIPPGVQHCRPRRHILHDLHEGFSYVYRFGTIRNILILVALVSLMGMPYTVLVPVIAKDILHGSAHTFGFLMTSAGGGALLGTLYLASRQSVVGLVRMPVAATCIFTTGITALALSDNFMISLTSMALAGFGAMMLLVSCNTILQTILDEDKRGRVVSFLTMSFIGIVPIGSLGAGAMGGIIGPRNTLLIGCSGCLVAAAIFARQLPRIEEEIRLIYLRLGIVR